VEILEKIALHPFWSQKMSDLVRSVSVVSIQSAVVHAGGSVVELPEIGRALGWAAGQSLWSLSDDEVVGRVDAAMRFRAQADVLLLAAVGEVDARDLARVGARVRSGRGCGMRTAATRGRRAG